MSWLDPKKIFADVTRESRWHYRVTVKVPGPAPMGDVHLSTAVHFAFTEARACRIADAVVAEWIAAWTEPDPAVIYRTARGSA